MQDRLRGLSQIEQASQEGCSNQANQAVIINGCECPAIIQQLNQGNCTPPQLGGLTVAQISNQLNQASALGPCAQAIQQANQAGGCSNRCAGAGNQANQAVLVRPCVNGVPGAPTAVGGGSVLQANQGGGGGNN